MSSIWDRALFEARLPFELREPPRRPSPASTWAARTIANLEAAFNGDDTRQRLVSVIWRCLRGELMDLLVRTTFQEVKAMIAKERLTMVRRDVAGFKVYDLDCLDGDFRRRFGDLVWDLVADDVKELIKLETVKKRPSRRKP